MKPTLSQRREFILLRFGAIQYPNNLIDFLWN